MVRATATLVRAPARDESVHRALAFPATASISLPDDRAAELYHEQPSAEGIG